ncbi:Thiol oxidoreductase [Lymphocystis disease virus 1]|uniref:Thiol oxidoreductase n=1 Tax=Fish lymphocystis disease virus TaxID=36363 RepID=UPI0000161EE9|nr:Thiol oxidoreductase [Lymphocystis disease virus 1]
MNRYLKKSQTQEVVVMHSKPTQNAFNPISFGPSLWYSLHTAASSISDPITVTDKKDWVNLLKSLAVLLPCHACKQHYTDIIKRTDLNQVTNTKKQLFCFLVDVHNVINLRTNKPEFSYNKAKKLYGYNGGPNLMLFINPDVNIFD